MENKGKWTILHLNLRLAVFHVLPPPPPMRHGSVAQVLHKKPDILTNGFYVVNGLSKRGEGQADEGGGKGGQRKGEERQEEGNHKIQ